MAKKLYVGSLSYNTDQNTLRSLFEPFGELLSASIISDKSTGQSKGFGFVEYEDENAAEKAMADLNGKEVDGRNLIVNEARPQAKREGGYGERKSFGDRASRRY